MSLDVSASKVNMVFTNDETGTFVLTCIPMKCLHKPATIAPDPLKELNIWTKERRTEIETFGKSALKSFSDVPVYGYSGHYGRNEKALTSLIVRRCVMNLLSNWPQDVD
eukprot:UN27188